MVVGAGARECMRPDTAMGDGEEVTERLNNLFYRRVSFGTIGIVVIVLVIEIVIGMPALHGLPAGVEAARCRWTEPIAFARWVRDLPAQIRATPPRPRAEVASLYQTSSSARSNPPASEPVRCRGSASFSACAADVWMGHTKQTEAAVHLRPPCGWSDKDTHQGRRPHQPPADIALPILLLLLMLLLLYRF
eukprot:COSAG01_NODE_1167_length_11440_cov_69.256238_6_plen_191_part_00